MHGQCSARAPIDRELGGGHRLCLLLPGVMMASASLLVRTLQNIESIKQRGAGGRSANDCVLDKTMPTRPRSVRCHVECSSLPPLTDGLVREKRVRSCDNAHGFRGRGGCRLSLPPSLSPLCASRRT